MTTDALRLAAQEKLAEASTSRFLDADNTLIDIPTAIAVLAQRPDALPTILGYAADRGASFGYLPSGALCILVDRGELQLFKQIAGSDQWVACRSRDLLLVQIEGKIFGVVPSDDSSPVTTPAAVKLAQVLGALENADGVARRKQAQQQEREQATEKRRQRIDAFAAARDEQNRANHAVHEQSERARLEAMERRRSVAKAELHAKLHSDDPRARAALVAARTEDMQARQAAEQEAQRLRQALEDARERYRLAQIDTARMG